MTDGQVQHTAKAGRLAKRIDQLSGLIWMGVGAFIYTHSQSLPYMSRFGPGPGFLMFWLSIGFVALGLMLLVYATWRDAGVSSLKLPDAQSAWQMFLVVGSYFIFVALIDPLGFFPDVALLSFFLLLAVERKGWLFSLIAAAIIGVGFWVTFDKLLQMWLPKGILEFFS